MQGSERYMTTNESLEPLAILKFGGNSIQADRTGSFVLKLVNGGEWKFDLGEIGKLDTILSEFTSQKDGVHEKVFWRTNGAKIIQVRLRGDWSPKVVYLVEGGTREGYFHHGEIPQLRYNIQILTSEGAPYGRPIRLLDVVEESRQEDLVTQQQVPLNNRNSNSALVIEREFSREVKKTIQTETSFGIGIDYYISLNLETRYGVTQEDNISERIMVKMEAQPGEYKIYTITWKEVWIKGHAVFEMGDSRHQKIPFRLKSGLEPHITQEIID